MASQLADALYAVRAVRLAGDAEGTPVTFKATGKTLVTPGWQAVYADDVADEDSDKDETSSNPIPALAVDAAHWWPATAAYSAKRPSRRFAISCLHAGHGNGKAGDRPPSTYAAILDNIMTREYITENERLPAAIDHRRNPARWSGEPLCVHDLEYTRGLEDQLDQIAEGKAHYIDVVSAAWASLDDELARP